MNPFDSYQGAVCLVTGGGSGIGAALVDALAEAGAEIWIADVAEDRLAERAQAVATAGATAHTAVCDIADRAQVAALFDRIASESGRLDVAFLNAGINAGAGFTQPGGALEEFAPETWRRVMDINLDGFFWTLQHTARLMKPQRSGAVVVTASTSGLRAEPMIGYAYIAAKTAVIGLTRQAALELAPYGIRVNAVAPGPINTRIGGSGPRPAEKTEAWERTVPLGRWGEAEEVAPLALLLGSSASGFTTGSVHVADGGASALAQVQAPALHRPTDG